MGTTQQTEMDAVFATAHDGRTYRVSDPLAWGEAQQEWQRLDAMQREGRMPHVKFFEVRTVFVGEDRPLVGPKITSHGRYDGAPLHMAYRTPVVENSRGFGKIEDAARAAWKRDFPTYRTAWDKRNGNREGTGEQGLGGWFYWPNGHTSAQGLRSLARVCENRSMIIQGGVSRWYVMAPSLTESEHKAAREEATV